MKQSFHHPALLYSDSTHVYAFLAPGELVSRNLRSLARW